MRRLSLVLFAVLVGSIRPCGAEDEETPSIGQEIKAAIDLASTSWDLPQIKQRYELALAHLQKFQEYPLWGSLVEDLDRQLEIVNWEIEGVAQNNPADPHGYLSVAAHLHDRFHEAEILDVNGKIETARQEFEACCSSWEALLYMHPTEQRAMVWQEIQACRARVPPRQAPRDYRAIDPHLST